MRGSDEPKHCGINSLRREKRRVVCLSHCVFAVLSPRSAPNNIVPALFVSLFLHVSFAPVKVGSGTESRTRSGPTGDHMDHGEEGGHMMMTDPVTLNVGGHLYTTSLSTLQRYPDSMLGAMFRGDLPSARDAQGNYFIDRDGPLFRYVLNFLRTSELTLPHNFKEIDLLRKEADFYQIEPLIQCLNDSKPLHPMDTFEQVVELSSTRKLSKYSNPVAVIITQLTVTTKVYPLLEGISSHFTKWNKHMMDTRDFQVSFTFGPCDYHQEVSLRVHLVEYITKQGFSIRNTRVHHMSERANENTVEHHWTFCRLARKNED
ncbi:BTB/POZ domain-containing protein KCTD6a isoform X1 [Scleropages formosus]|uniref:BTB/POZ domain-containing protein KCTD6a isoform X1 n=1 Tax=Scleropages formosus TaxID=113540 RepID=UPI0010FA7619|nr:BTB/POZ domain-containing protein KCTD6 isoform X1 [Scleropages formosus]